MAARRAHNPKVVGSSPTPATKNKHKNDPLVNPRGFLFAKWSRNGHGDILWRDPAIGEDSDQAARATGIVLDILRRLDTIGGLIPEMPLIQLQQQNVVVGGVTFADLLREAMASLAGAVGLDHC